MCEDKVADLNLVEIDFLYGGILFNTFIENKLHVLIVVTFTCMIYL